MAIVPRSSISTPSSSSPKPVTLGFLPTATTISSKGSRTVSPAALGDEHADGAVRVGRVRAVDGDRVRAGHDAYALGLEAALHVCRDVGVLATHDPVAALDLPDLAAETRERLRQLAADRTAAEDDEALRLHTHLPEVLGGAVRDLGEPRDRRHERGGAGGDDDVARRQRASVHLDRPRRDDACAALDDVDAKPAVALGGVVRLDLGDDPLDALHRRGEVEPVRGLGDAVVARVADVVDELGRADQRLRGHAAGVEAVTAHRALLDQRHLGADGGADVGGDEPAGARADDDHVAIEALRSDVTPVLLVSTEHVSGSPEVRWRMIWEAVWLSGCLAVWLSGCLAVWLDVRLVRSSVVTSMTGPRGSSGWGRTGFSGSGGRAGSSGARRRRGARAAAPSSPRAGTRRAARTSRAARGRGSRRASRCGRAGCRR